MNINSLLNKSYNFYINEFELKEKIKSFVNEGQGGLFTYFNQHSFNVFYSNSDFREVLKHFNIYQEGIGMYLLLRLKGVENVTRIDSTEVLYFIFNEIIISGEKVSFIGGDYDSKEIFERCKKKNLNLEFYHHGFFDLNEISDLVKKLEQTSSKFILLGMGTPKQEIVAYQLSKSFPERKFVCIGYFMNYFLEYKKRAPLLLRKLQLEWFYRLMLEPKRMFKRYVLGIPMFFIRGLFLFRNE
jgi:exopolysaccharide biosynthesis WecB/TagA/CpsF family protein